MSRLLRATVLIIAGRLVYKPRFYDSPLLSRAAVVVIDLIIQSTVVYVAASIGLAVFMSEDLSKPRPKWIISGIPSFIVSYLVPSSPSRG